MPDAPEAEVLLCDSSFVGILPLRLATPDKFEHWPDDVMERIDAAILAISVVTLAESRYGYLNADWGARRIEADERRLEAFLRVPLDMSTVEEWARLKHRSQSEGLGVGDNDLWIAATAAARGYPLVTCDNDQYRLDDRALELIYLPRRPEDSPEG